MMFSMTLFRRELRGASKSLLIFAGILTLYMSIVTTMYDPEMQEQLNAIVAMMPEIMDAMGMKAGSTTLLGFLASYLYGFILIAFPMVFSILCANRLIARYVDSGSMVSLLAAPTPRHAVAFTQMKVLATCIILLVLYATGLELGVSAVFFPGELDVPGLLVLNAGLLALHLFIGGVCFLCSCLFSDTKYSIGFGAGLPALSFILQMLANTGGKAEPVKYATFFTLFRPNDLIAGEGSAVLCAAILFVGAIVLFGAGIAVFSKKDLHI